MGWIPQSPLSHHTVGLSSSSSLKPPSLLQPQMPFPVRKSVIQQVEAGTGWDSPQAGGGGADWSRASFRWSLFSGQTGVGGRGPPLFLKAFCSSDLSFLSGGWKVTSPPTPAVCVCVRVPHTPSSSPHTPSCNYALSSCLFGSGRRNLAQHSYPVKHCLQA